MKSTLEQLFAGQTLSMSEAKETLSAIGQGLVNDFQIASLLTCYRMRPITGAELAGFREAMIALAVPVDLGDHKTIDLCGTGGDGKDTFNISTTASFVVAGAGYKVAKHGNSGVSSPCGSSNVLDHLGYEMTNDVDKLRDDLEKGNFCYMHAPLFHPAMKHVGAVRRGIGVKTFFNILGPLLNPSQPGLQITGVYSEDLMPLYQEVFEEMGSEYAVIRSVDGYDEISLTGAFAMVRRGETMSTYEPATFGLDPLEASELHGGNSIQDAADILVNVLSGKGTPGQTQVVCANAALAIQRFQPNRSLQDCFAEARSVIRSGAGLEKLRAVTN
ncbi:MAG: anthranilate phosphoribosyltransferase [Saprospiraceae bacterium]|nr:anthranilate phosphoribosyltransferase [Saprospiraceae bacterium]